MRSRRQVAPLVGVGPEAAVCHESRCSESDHKVVVNDVALLVRSEEADRLARPPTGWADDCLSWDPPANEPPVSNRLPSVLTTTCRASGVRTAFSASPAVRTRSTRASRPRQAPPCICRVSKALLTIQPKQYSSRATSWLLQRACSTLAPDRDAAPIRYSAATGPAHRA